MTLLFIESFDAHGTSSLEESLKSKWGAAEGANVGVTGRFGGIAATVSSATSLLTPRFGDEATMVVGFWLKRLTGSVSTGVLTFRRHGSSQAGLRFNTSNNLQVFRSFTTLGTGSTTITNGVWYFVEIKCTIDNTVGAVELRIDGQQELDLTNVDTQEGTGSFANEIEFGTSISGTFAIDDLYILDTNGSENDDFLNEIRIEVIKPIGDGNSTDWSVTGESNNWEAVNDDETDEDSTYVSTGTATDKDMYDFENTESNSEIIGIQVNTHVRKAEIGNRTFSQVVRSEATDTELGTSPVFDDYQYELNIRETDPTDSVKWNRGKINAAQFGHVLKS